MQIAHEVLNVLNNSETIGALLKLPAQLDRGLYLQTNKVLEAAGGKWQRKLGAHLFPEDAATRIDQILLTGKVEIPKDEFNYFWTPKPIVERLIQLANIQPGMLVKEPSAGQGAIALEIVKRGAQVHMVELMEANFEKLVSLNIGPVIKADFLTLEPTGNYDRIIMNPPFFNQSDIKHVNHALQFLKPDGVLVSVMASNITFRDNRLTKDFRALIEERGGSIETCPQGSFKEAGTMVSTVIVTIPAST